MDKQLIIHDLKESNLKMKILIQMIASALREGTNIEVHDQVNQLLDELSQTKVILSQLD